MQGDLIALDLETTGLDSAKDAIIEVGAVRLRDGEVIEEFGTLINPGFQIPSDTTYITGIDTDDVQDSPNIHQVVPKLADFVSNLPIIAHNISFDLAFLQKYKLGLNNQPIDTFELASLVVPKAPRYNLTSLVQLFNISLENAHRALDDARATALLYWKLWERITELPSSLLQEILQLGADWDWHLEPVFANAYQLKSSEGTSEISAGFPLETRSEDNGIQIQPSKTIMSIDSQQIETLFGKGGKLSKRLDAYEFRPQQMEMSLSIAEAFNDSHHLIVEAGTGIGKSLAYLLPSVLWATENGQRVVISTQTINLQDQLLNNDIPLLKEVIDPPFHASVMKGRNNYLCPRRLETLRRRRPTNVDELRTVIKVLIWLQNDASGEKNQITLRANEVNTWNRLSAQDEGCTTQRCIAQMYGSCPYHQARKSAEKSHIIIVNHALLMADAMAENHILPSYSHLIIDEAHQFEEAITHTLTAQLDSLIISRRIDDLRALLAEFLQSADNIIPTKLHINLQEFIKNINDASSVMTIHLLTYFQAIDQFLANIFENRRGRYIPQLRIVENHRRKENFSIIQTAWDKLAPFFEAVVDALNQLGKALNRLEKYDIPNQIDLFSGIRSTANYLSEANIILHDFTESPNDNTIYSLQLNQYRDGATIRTSPIHVGDLLNKHLLETKDTVVLTSATLQTAGNFDHFKSRLQAEAIEASSIGSPFDYKSSTMIVIPSDLPEPNQPGYQRGVEQGIIELATALQGRMLVLFTSYAQLIETAKAITPRLALGDIVVYDQNQGTGRDNLLETFKNSDKAVLLGTRSFWQGVDIPGDDLSAVVIVRLPFTVPSDPIFAARSEVYADGFNEYAVPDAILRFRQGFGRLIRSQEDRGIVALFDVRVKTKRYGQLFLDSLPDCTIKTSSLANLPQLALQWLQEVNSSSEHTDANT